MFKKYIVISVLAVIASFAIAPNVFGVEAASTSADREWYVSLKRTAKYGRISVATRNGEREANERAAAYRSVVAADHLALPYREICKKVAWAVVEAIESGRDYGWPEGTESPFRRAERLGDQCLAAINGR